MQLILVQKDLSIRIVEGEVFTMASNSVALPEEKVFSGEELAQGITHAYLNACASERISVIVRVPHPKPATTEQWYNWRDDMINAAVELKGIFLFNEAGKTQAIKCVNRFIEHQLLSLERQKTSILAMGQNAIQAILGDVMRSSDRVRVNCK